MIVDVVIPARYASSRLPGKPLLKSTGKYLVQHVYERALRARSCRRVIIATDDRRIRAAVEGFGGECVMTSPGHASGTDRVAEVARTLDSDVLINLQGDEPEVDPEHVETLAELLRDGADADVATLAVPFSNESDWRDPNRVKVVCDASGRALYFSRSPVPHVRDGGPNFAQRPSRFLQHVGLYAYRRPFLLSFPALPASPLESLERLEQLRILEAGRAIRVGVVGHAAAGVDTFDDYERFRKSLAGKPARTRAA
jgi:3-deoxy-manno-octulosonate cytidylyltransferase (CMP-KDO synthetase)